MKAVGDKLLKLEVPGLAENRPSVLKGDKIYAQLHTASGIEQVEYEGVVHQVEDSSIIVGFSRKLRSKFIPNMSFNIRFTFNRFPMRNMHRATEFMSQHKEFESFIFPKSNQREVESQSRLSFFDANIASNQEQSLAVSNIVNGGIQGKEIKIIALNSDR